MFTEKVMKILANYIENVPAAKEQKELKKECRNVITSMLLEKC